VYFCYYKCIFRPVPVHEDVLWAAVAVCRDREGWEFQPGEIVEALPHLHEATVRTHVSSRLCVNAPANHSHRWPYFSRVRRGVYEILPPYRHLSPRRPPDQRPRKHIVAGEAPRAVRDTAHAVVSRDLGWYVAECLEVPVIAQGRTLDELVVALRTGIERRLSTEDPGRFGLTRAPRVVLTYEFRLSHPMRHE
jgi:hypothetical protein